MAKWIVKNNKGIEEKEFENFDSAVLYFKKIIRDYIVENEEFYSYFAPTPIDRYFYTLRLNRKLEGLPHQMENRIDDYFDGLRKAGRRIFRYNDFKGHLDDDEICIDLEVKENEVVLDYSFYNGSYLKTNAFNFINKKKNYYFCDYEVLDSRSSFYIHELGDVASIEVYLERVSK